MGGGGCRRGATTAIAAMRRFATSASDSLGGVARYQSQLIVEVFFDQGPRTFSSFQALSQAIP